MSDIENKEDVVNTASPEIEVPVEESKQEANFTEDQPCKEAGKASGTDEEVLRLAVAMERIVEFQKALSQSPNMNFEADEKGRRWLEALGEASMHFTREGVLEGSLDREGSIWSQAVEHEGERISAARPRTKSNDGPTQLSGDRAIFRLTTSMGLGTVVQIPLWHSGIWVTIKAPSDAELLELERSIAFDKIELGRHTNGILFSSNSVYIVNKLMNFILKNVYDSSLKTNSVKSLKRSILTTDIPLLVWGMTVAIYPNGYPFSQPCTANTEDCQHVTEEHLNLSKLCWTDKSSLSVKQLNHMADRSKSFQHAELERYREEHVRGVNRLVKITDNVSVRLSVPNLEMYESAGFKWVDSVVRMVDTSFSHTVHDDERNEYINQQAQASALRQFSHWISEIVLDDTDSIVDRDTIDQALDRISGDDKASDTLFIEINKYIDDSTLSLIAIPQYDCPACGSKQSGEHPEFKHLIPLGISQLFFTLLGQRIQKILRV